MHLRPNAARRYAVAVVLATMLTITTANAISVEVAKKCNGLVAKQFPPREPGNPAAGSAKGNGQAANDYFKKCVGNGGKMEDQTDKK
jgi:hypothetical protein